MANASVRASVRAQEKAAERSAAVRAEVITSLMSHPSGREYVHDILSQAHVFHTSFTTDVSQMCFAEGERSFGLRFLADVMDHCPEQFIQMMRETNARSDLDRTEPQPVADIEPDPSPDDAPGDHLAVRRPTGSDIYGVRQ